LFRWYHVIRPSLTYQKFHGFRLCQKFLMCHEIPQNPKFLTFLTYRTIRWFLKSLLIHPSRWCHENHRFLKYLKFHGCPPILKFLMSHGFRPNQLNLMIRTNR
jgi:hypothetical protein